MMSDRVTMVQLDLTRLDDENREGMFDRVRTDMGEAPGQYNVLHAPDTIIPPSLVDDFCKTLANKADAPVAQGCNAAVPRQWMIVACPDANYLEVFVYPNKVH